MNNEREAVIALSGLRQMRGELTDGAGEQMRPIKPFIVRDTIRGSP